MVNRAQSSNGAAVPLTIKTAVETYLAFLDSHGKSAVDARHRANAHIYPTLGDIEVPSLTTVILRHWLIKLAKIPPRARTRPGKPQQHRRFDGSEDAIRRRKSSANRTWTILRAALNHAFRDDLVASDGAWRKVESFKGVDAARVRYLTVEQAIDLLRAERTPTGNDFQQLADYVERLHRKPGRTEDATVHDNALVADAIFDHFRLATGRTRVPDKVRQRVYYYICGINPEMVDHPERLNDVDAEKLGAVAKLSEHIRKGRHVPVRRINCKVGDRSLERMRQEEQNVPSPKRFCVYAIRVDGVLRYIGKGSNGRMHAHMKEVRQRLTRKFNLKNVRAT